MCRRDRSTDFKFLRSLAGLAVTVSAMVMRLMKVLALALMQLLHLRNTSCSSCDLFAFPIIQLLGQGDRAIMDLQYLLARLVREYMYRLVTTVYCEMERVQYSVVAAKYHCTSNLYLSNKYGTSTYTRGDSALRSTLVPTPYSCVTRCTVTRAERPPRTVQESQVLCTTPVPFQAPAGKYQPVARSWWLLKQHGLACRRNQSIYS